MGYSMVGIIFFGLWELWKHCYKLKFEGGMLNSTAVIYATIRQVRELNTYCDPKCRHTRWEEVMLESLSIPVKAVSIRRGTRVMWSKPPAPQFKLNTDGSKKGSHTTGGGGLRDDQGDAIFAFAMPLHHSDILQVELDALLQGLILCKERGICRVLIETDSAMAFNMIMRKSTEAWNYIYSIRTIMRLLIFFGDFYLTTREANMVADDFARRTRWKRRWFTRGLRISFVPFRNLFLLIE